MSQVRSITLRDFNALLPQYLVVNYISDDAEWQVTSLEILDESKKVIADGIEFAMLPTASQMAILGALHEHDHEQKQRRHGMMRLLNDLRADAAAQRVLEGARQ
jgi:hypothetical protein